MKSLFFGILLFGAAFQALSQTKSPTTNPVEILEKSNNQYITGWILLGTGTASWITSRAITPRYDNNYGSTNQTVISILGWVGALSLISSIPVFLSSGQNARMAARLSLENQAIHQPIPYQVSRGVSLL